MEEILKCSPHLQELNSALVQPVSKGDLGGHVDQGHILTLGTDGEKVNESFCRSYSTGRSRSATHGEHDVRSPVHQRHALAWNPKRFDLVGEETAVG